MEQSKVFSYSVDGGKVNIIVTRENVVSGVLDASIVSDASGVRDPVIVWSMLFSISSPLGCWFFKVKRFEDADKWYKLMKSDKYGFAIDDDADASDYLARRGWIEVRGDQIKFRRWCPGHTVTYKAPRGLIVGALGWALDYITRKPHVCAGL